MGIPIYFQTNPLFLRENYMLVNLKLVFENMYNNGIIVGGF